MGASSAKKSFFKSNIEATERKFDPNLPIQYLPTGTLNGSFIKTNKYNIEGNFSWQFEKLDKSLKELLKGRRDEASIFSKSDIFFPSKFLNLKMRILLELKKCPLEVCQWFGIYLHLIECPYTKVSIDCSFAILDNAGNKYNIYGEILLLIRSRLRN